MTELAESGVSGEGLGVMVDVRAMDAEQASRRAKHPFEVYCERVMSDCGVRPTQAAREVCSAVCGDVARLVDVVEDDVQAQADHIAQLIAKDRAEQGDRQLWHTTAKKLAEHALQLRLSGDKSAVVVDPEAVARTAKPSDA